MQGIFPRVCTPWRLLGDPGEQHPARQHPGCARRRPWQTAHGVSHAPAPTLDDLLTARTRVGAKIHSAKERPMSNRSDPIEWTPEVVLSLRQLWDEGHSTAEIGRRLGVSKNAVVGKAHRLDLSRPSARTSLTDRRISSGRRRNGQRTSLLACSKVTVAPPPGSPSPRPSFESGWSG